MKLATIGDAASLAWVTAQAFTRRRRGNKTVRAVLAYPVHLVTMAQMILNKEIYHFSRQAVVAIQERGKSTMRGQLIVGIAVGVVELVAILPWLTGAVGILSGAGIALILPVALLVSAYSTRPSHGPGTSESALRRHLDRQVSRKPRFIFTFLARSPKAAPGAAGLLLQEALNIRVPAGSVIGCIAATPALFTYYEGFGLHQIGSTQIMINPAWAPSLDSGQRTA